MFEFPEFAQPDASANTALRVMAARLRLSMVVPSEAMRLGRDGLRRSTTRLVEVRLNEPHPRVGPLDDLGRTGLGVEACRELLDPATGGDPADLRRPDLVGTVGLVFGKPDRSVGARGEIHRAFSRRDALRVFGHGPARGDAADAPPFELGDPRGAVGTGDDRIRLRTLGDAGRVFGDFAAPGDSPNAISDRFGKPERPVWAYGDVLQRRTGRYACAEGGELPTHRDSRDGRAFEIILSEPHRVIWARHDTLGTGAVQRKRCKRSARGHAQDLTVCRVADPQRAVRAGRDIDAPRAGVVLVIKRLRSLARLRDARDGAFARVLIDVVAHP